MHRQHVCLIQDVRRNHHSEYYTKIKLLTRLKLKYVVQCVICQRSIFISSIV